jgi:hypothetical protein
VVYSTTTSKNTPNNQNQDPKVSCITAILTTKAGANSANTQQNITDTSTIGPILDKG